MFEKVLVPLDGSELAEGILPYVSELARGLNMPVVLLSVIDPDEVELPDRLRLAPSDTPTEYMAPGGTGVGGVGVVRPQEESYEHAHTYPHETGEPHATQVFDAVAEDAREKLAGVAERLRDNGIKAEYKVAFGKVADEIAEVARREGCDLIAMSTHGRNAIGRGLLGSVTDKIIHIGHVPILTITPERARDYWEEDTTITKVMVPLDGSELAESVLPYIEELATKMSLEVMLVRVLKMGGAYAAYANGYPYVGNVDIEAEVEAVAVEYLKEVAERLEAKGLTVSWNLLKGAPAVSIVDLARETPHDLIAIATHGRSGLTRWVIGSVAETLVRASGDPVLVIPPE